MFIISIGNEYDQSIKRNLPLCTQLYDSLLAKKSFSF